LPSTGEIRKAMRALLLALERLPKAADLGEICERRLSLAPLAAEIGLLVVDELEGELIAVLREKAPRAERVAAPDLEHVMAHDPPDARAQRVGVAKSVQRASGELRADLLVAALRAAGLRVVVQPSVRPAPGDVRLPEIVEECREAHRERGSGVRGRLHDGERVLVDG